MQVSFARFFLHSILEDKDVKEGALSGAAYAIAVQSCIATTIQMSNEKPTTY
jgi:hypothetical protein